MAQVSEDRKRQKVIWRLPDGMRDKLAAAAAANNRSSNAEAVSRLEMSFDWFDLDEGLRFLAENGIRLMRPDGTYFTEEEAREELLNLPSKLQEDRVKGFGEQLERGLSRLEESIDRIETRLEAIETELLSPKPEPPSKVKRKPRFKVTG